MTTIDTGALTPAPTRKLHLLGLAWIRDALERRRRRKFQFGALMQLSQLDAYMLRDIGIDPRDVEAATHLRSLSVLFYPLRPRDR